MEVMKTYLGEDVALVSVMAGNNEIGTIQPVKEIAKLAHEVGAYIHTDATQAIGKIPVSMQSWDVDYLSLSGHKFYGPKGIGVLAIKAKSPHTPLVHGGHQEGGESEQELIIPHQLLVSGLQPLLLNVILRKRARNSGLSGKC